MIGDITSERSDLKELRPVLPFTCFTKRQPKPLQEKVNYLIYINNSKPDLDYLTYKANRKGIWINRITKLKFSRDLTRVVFD